MTNNLTCLVIIMTCSVDLKVVLVKT